MRRAGGGTSPADRLPAVADIRAGVDEVLPGVRANLERLVRIPSVSAPGFDPAEVRRSAEASAEILQRSGLSGVRLLELDGAHPAVLGDHPAPAGAPTVLLYAHHDVQPQGDEADWETPPFEPVERDGRLYGRGTSDDKAGIAMHDAAMRAHEGTPPVGVTAFIEGEEEIGSTHLTEFLERYGELLRADVIVLADMANWRVGEPALTTSLRGLVDCVVEVRTLDHAVHSGMFGGPFPDAVTALSRLLATLHDDKGRVAISGLRSSHSDELDLTEKELRQQSGALPGVNRIGEGGLTSQIWTMPSVSVLGIDAPRIGEAANKLVPVARAKVSLRIAPGDDPDRAMDALVSHLESNAPWGAEVLVTRGARARPFALRAEGPVFDAARGALEEAWGVAPVDIGAGGSIPFVAAFADAFPKTPILLTGAADPDSRAHGANESLHLDDFANACLAEALLLERLAT
jgi:acetylornithine deacetylase/succinyl-diaminopimelate desuccinylase-like protein